MNPAIFLPFIVAFAIAYAGESAWRLWRQRPGKYLSVPGEVFSAGMMIVVAFIAIPTEGLGGMIAKAVASLGFALAGVLRVIARQRFAVTS